MSIPVGQIVRALRPVLVPAASGLAVFIRNKLASTSAQTQSGGTVSTSAAPPDPADARGFYPGDYIGVPTLKYSPHLNNSVPDSGEVAWAWVPYEEDWTQGKDRPVLIVGYDNGWYLGLPLSSVDHDLDERQEASEGRYWVELGTGPWDTQGRDSFVRVDRVVRLHPETIRRIGGQVSEAVWDKVAAGLRVHWND